VPAVLGRRSAAARAVVSTWLLGPVLLAGCAGSSGSSGTQVTAAPSAAAPSCATALAAAPATVLGRPRAPLPVAGTAAWGEPPVVARCGLPEQPPTTKQCLTVNGVDWIVDDSGDPFVFTAYGRSPGVEVRVPASVGRDAAPSALVELAPVASALPRTARRCLG
jgi:Protein of unknown function (DUF3515)